MNLKARLARLEGAGEVASIGEILDCLEEKGALPPLDPRLVAFLADMEC